MERKGDMGFGGFGRGRKAYGAFSPNIILKRAGFTKNELGVYLIYGLPGQSLDEVKEGVELLKSLNVHINLTEFSPIPNTKMWNELLTKGIISKDIDFLLTNNSVYYYLYSGYDLKEIERLKLEVKSYNSM